MNEHVHAELYIAESVGGAIEQMGRRMPDVIIVPALLSPHDGATLSAHVKQLHGVPYVQLLTIPAFDMLGEPEAETRRGMGLFRRQAPALRRYDRGMVGSQIADAVARAREAREEYVAWLGHQAELEELGKLRAARRLNPAAAGALVPADQQGRDQASDDRRAALRKPLGDIPWLSRARLAWGAEIALVNISTSGVLLESGSKFAPGTTTDLHLSGPETNLVVPVRFVRSEISKIDALGVRYQAAARFGEEIDLGGPSRARALPASPPQALAALLESALVKAAGSAEPAHALFVRGVREMVGARDMQLRTGMGSAGGRETLYFEVPGDDHARTVLQVVFDRSHNVSSAELKLLKAAAWLTAAALEFDRPAPVGSDAPKPRALLEAQVA